METMLSWAKISTRSAEFALILPMLPHSLTEPVFRELWAWFGPVPYMSQNMQALFSAPWFFNILSSTEAIKWLNLAGPYEFLSFFDREVVGPIALYYVNEACVVKRMLVRSAYPEPGVLCDNRSFRSFDMLISYFQLRPFAHPLIGHPYASPPSRVSSLPRLACPPRSPMYSALVVSMERLHRRTPRICFAAWPWVRACCVSAL